MSSYNVGEMTDVRLYLFHGGTLKTQLQNIKLNQGLGEPFEFPVPWFLVTHPRGNVLIDGGNAAEAAVDPAGHWGAITASTTPVFAPEQAVVPALRAAGIDPASVRYILQSHLHHDHTGALAAYAAFPDATVIARRAEYEYALAPDWFIEHVYIRADYVKPGIRWELLGDEDGYDLFGDGVIRLWTTPGHSPGHQSFEITLPSSGSWLLTADAVYTLDHWEERALPSLMTSAIDLVRSVRKLRRIAERSRSTVVTGHDPDAWATFRHAPAYYD